MDNTVETKGEIAWSGHPDHGRRTGDGIKADETLQTTTYRVGFAKVGFAAAIGIIGTAHTSINNHMLCVDWFQLHNRTGFESCTDIEGNAIYAVRSTIQGFRKPTATNMV